jgi:hypothetical protein
LALVITDVSDECGASIVRVTRWTEHIRTRNEMKVRNVRTVEIRRERK